MYCKGTECFVLFTFIFCMFICDDTNFSPPQRLQKCIAIKAIDSIPKQAKKYRILTVLTHRNY